MTTTTQLGIQVRLDASYEEAIERATTALKEQGFGVLTEIDVQATLKQKLNVDFKKYKILGGVQSAAGASGADDCAGSWSAVALQRDRV